MWWINLIWVLPIVFITGFLVGMALTIAMAADEAKLDKEEEEDDDAS